MASMVEYVVVGVLALGGGAGAAGDCANGVCTGGQCFAAGTLVSTERGLVPIEDVRVGDRVE